MVLLSISHKYNKKGIKFSFSMYLIIYLIHFKQFFHIKQKEYS